MLDTTSHPQLSLALDVADKVIKLAAVFIGGAWTWWNYRKSRTYRQKLELEVSGTVFIKQDLYGDVNAVLRNLSAAQDAIQREGTTCELIAIHRNLREERIRLFRVFSKDDRLEPGESVNDTLYWSIANPGDDIVWIKLYLRVVSTGLQWNKSCLIRVEDPTRPQDSQEEVIE